MTVFSYADYRVEVNISNESVPLSTDYIERLLFIAIDDTLTAGDAPVYVQDIIFDDARVPASAQYILDYYFYKNSVKSCDALFVPAGTNDFDTLLTQEQKDLINDRTFTISLDKNIDINDLTLTFFNGILQRSIVAIEDASQYPKETLIFYKIDASNVEEENKENARFASWFVNRANFFNTPNAGKTDYIFNEDAIFSDITKIEADILASNNLTFFMNSNGETFIANFNVGRFSDIVPYYEEKIRRTVQLNILNKIFSPNAPRYTQETLNRIYQEAENAALTYAKAPYGFVAQEGVFVKKNLLADIPAADIAAKIVRVEMEVVILNIVQKVQINLTFSLSQNS